MVNLEKQKCTTITKQQFQLEHSSCQPFLTILDNSVNNSTSLNSSSDLNMSSITPNKSIHPFLNEETNISTCNFDSFTPTYVEPETPISIEDKLRSWVLNFKVPHNCTNSLLSLLKSEGLNVPNDVRTLMKTPKIHNICNVGNGTYTHLGLKNMLEPILVYFNEHLCPNYLHLRLSINIDGLPISKSSKSQVWPILISFTNCEMLSKYVLPIGIFHGNTKPKCINEFLNPFVIELVDLLDIGLCINGNEFKFEVAHIICDAPAKAFLLNVKGHNAYFGCNSCIQEGTYLEHRMAFLENDSPLRSDESFRAKIQEDYHKGKSPLELLPINIVNTVSLDYMHNVCLGVMKRLLEFWIKGKKDVRITDQNKTIISNELMNLRSYVPSEFCRLPRELDVFEYWKATELRFFLLYSGLIVLKGKLPRKYYLHFRLLVSALRILVCDDICQTHNHLAENFLKEFISQYSLLYGPHHVSYNVHSLLHLPKFVEIHGSLDHFSCFKFENYLQELKKCIKSSKYPLQELTNRIFEKQKHSFSKKYEISNPVTIGNELNIQFFSYYLTLADKLYDKITLHDRKLSINVSKEKDKCIMLKNLNIVVVTHIIKRQNESEFKLIVKKFLNFSNFYSSPILSSNVQSFKVNTTFLSDEYIINVSDVKYKCFYVPISNKNAVVITLCHNLNE